MGGLFILEELRKSLRRVLARNGRHRKRGAKIGCVRQRRWRNLANHRHLNRTSVKPDQRLNRPARQRKEATRPSMTLMS